MNPNPQKSTLRKRIIVISTFFILALPPTLYYSLKWTISTKWKTYFSEADMINLGSSVQSSDPLPENFKKVVYGVYPNSRRAEIEELYFDIFWKEITQAKYLPRRQHSSSNIFSKRIYDLTQDSFRENLHGLFNEDLVFAFGIENYATPDKCVDYYFNNVSVHLSSPPYVMNGVNEVSQFLFNRELEDLNQREAIRVFVHTDQYKSTFCLDCDSNLISKRMNLIEAMIHKEN